MAGSSNPPIRDGRAPNVAYGSVPFTNVGFRPLPKSPYTNPLIPKPDVTRGAGRQPLAPAKAAATGTTEETNLMDYGPDDEDQGPAIGQYEAGPQAIGMDRSTYNMGLRGDGSAADKRAAAKAMGYQTGQVSPGEALMKGFGMLSGVPGLGFVTGKISDKMEDVGAPWFGLEEGVPRAGSIGSVDYATGDVWGQDQFGNTRGYDPITGRASANYTSAGDWWDSTKQGYGNLREAGENPISAGLGSWENSVYNVSDAERQQGITPASKAGALPERAAAGDNQYYGRSGVLFTDGISEGVPGAGTTFASGNLRTDETGKVVEAAVPTIDVNTGRQVHGETHFQSDDDDYDSHHDGNAWAPETNSGWGNDAGGEFGGTPTSNDDGGGGGGGK